METIVTEDLVVIIFKGEGHGLRSCYYVFLDL